MGKCIYCGQKAGLFSDKHKECEQKYLNGQSEIVKLIESTIVEADDFSNLKADIEKIATECYIPTTRFDNLFTKGYDKAVEKFLEDGIITKEEEEKLDKFQEQLQLSQGVVNKNNSLAKVTQAAIVRELSEGTIPEDRFGYEGILPVNFQKGEKLIWLFPAVEFYEQRIKTHYEGGYSGVSFRVARGVSVRTGGFRGNPVKTEEMKYITTGDFIVTTKSLYFSSSSKSVKLPLQKILRIEPYRDGIGLQKDTATAKPQVFKGLDGLFVYDVVTHLNQM